MALKQVDSYPAGGVSSRDNPANYPLDRYLRVRNFWPQPNGELRLRDGYSLYVNGPQANVPVHSIVGVRGPGPGYRLTIVFWQGTTPYLLDPGTRVITSPTVRGTPIQSSARFCYFYTGGHLHAYNGTDAKWFDGIVWRDIGLPKLTADQILNIVISEGLHAISSTDAAAVGLALASGGNWIGNDTYGVLVYMAFFDRDTNQVMGSTIPLGNGTRKKGTVGQKLNLTNLPASASANIIKMFGITDDGGTRAGFAITRFLTQTTSFPTTAPDDHTVNINAPAHGLTTGDVIVFNVVRTSPTNPPYKSAGPFAVTVIDASNFTFQVEPGQASLYPNMGTTGVLLKAETAVTTASILSNILRVTGGWMVDDVNSDTAAGLPASNQTLPNPGYQFYASIYNPIGGGHVGNRIAIGARFNNTSQANVVITGLPDLSAIDDEWVILLGRTGDGAQIPYAIINPDGSWVTVPSGADTITLTQSDIDGDSELPSRNFPPPHTLDYDAQVGA